MKPDNNSEVAIKQMAHLGAAIENSLMELQQVDSTVRHLQLCLYDIQLHKELNTMRNRELMLRSLLSSFHVELQELKSHMNKSEGVITIGEIVSRNKLRDKVMKAEQDVLTLKASVNQLLSKAS
jgi:hypothetical protein